MTKDENQMIKKSLVDYLTGSVSGHWRFIEHEMEGSPKISIENPSNMKVRALPFGGDPARARRITSLDAAQGVHTFKIRTENTKGTQLVSPQCSCPMSRSILTRFGTSGKYGPAVSDL